MHRANRLWRQIGMTELHITAGDRGEVSEGIGGRQRSFSSRDFRSDLGQDDPSIACHGKLLNPSRSRACLDHVIKELGVSERRACWILTHQSSTQHKAAETPDEQAGLTADITACTLVRPIWLAESQRFCARPAGRERQSCRADMAA